MFRQFFKDSAIYGISNLLCRGVSLFVLLLYTRVLSPADYGIIDILNIVTAVVNTVVALEISQGVAIYYSEAKTNSDRVAYASSALGFTVFTNSLFLIVALSFSKPLSFWILGSSHFQNVFQIAAIYMFINSIFLLLQNQLRWQLKPKHYAASSFVFSLASAGTTSLLLLVLNSGIIGIFYGLLTGQILAGAMILYFTRNSYFLVFDWQKCKKLLAFSSPLVFSTLSIWVSLSIDRIAIKQLMELSDVGLYGIGYRFAYIPSLFLAGFYAAITPIIFNNYEKPNAPKELAKVFRYFLTLVLPMLVGISIFSRELLILFTTPDYYPASQVIPLLSSAIILSNMSIFTPGLDLAKKTVKIAVINISAALANCIFNFVLIPYIGIAGAALATLLTTLVAFVVYMIASQTIYYVPHQWNRIIPATGIAIVLGVIGFGFGELVRLPIVEILAMKFLLLVICIALVSLLLIGTQELNYLTKAIVIKIKP